jgi:hypothetical protein
MAVYAWSPKNQKAARQITNLMDNVKWVCSFVF